MTLAQSWRLMIRIFAVIGILAAFSALSLAIYSRAHAADLPQKAPAVAVATPAYFLPWAGSYGGFQFGYGYDWSNLNANPGIADLAGSPSGWTGGARIGYDWNLGYVVFGVVADANYAGFSNSGQILNMANWSTRTNWWTTEDIRIGLPQFGNHMLLYGVGGLACGGKTLNVTGASASDTSCGWNAGAGLGVKITPSAELFAEAKFIDLGSLSVPLGGNVTATQKYNFGVFNGGLLFHF